MKDRNKDSQSIFIGVFIFAFVYTRIQGEFTIDVFLQIFSIAGFTWWGVSVWTETNSLGIGHFIGRVFTISKESLQFIFWELPKGLFFFGTYLFSYCSQKCKLRGAIGREKSYTYFNGLADEVMEIIERQSEECKRACKRGRSIPKKGTIIN